MADQSNDDDDTGGPDAGRSPASPNLGLGRIPGCGLDELTEVVAHEHGFVLGQATQAFNDRHEPFMTGYVKGYRRALFQVATARFGSPKHHDDALWALTDLREIVRLLDRVATASGWQEVLQPLYDRLRAEEQRRIDDAYVRLLADGTERFGRPTRDVLQMVDYYRRKGDRWHLHRLADRVPETSGWQELIGG